MRKLFILILLCLFVNLFSYAQEYVVQIAAFDTKVKLDYFNGLNGIYHIEDHNNIHKYYIGGFKDKSGAETKAKEAQNLGYKAYVVDLEAIRDKCGIGCGVVPADPEKLQSIFFDFDKSFLRPKSKRQLDHLYSILAQNVKYTVELSAHTDAKGSLEYNTALSNRRANAAKAYLMAKGIPENRIKISTFGENAPIAKNAMADGKDTPEGRQYNRRVELIIHNSKGAIEPIVEDIQVPATLKQD